MTPRVHFVGAGPGDPELLTLKAARLLARADLVIHPGSLTPKAVTDMAAPGARILDSASMTLEETHAAIRDTVLAGGFVVRLQAGDPALYGTVAEQARLLEAEGIDYAVVPGVTAASAASAALRIPATAPEVTQTLVLTRLAGRTPVPEAENLRALAAHKSALAVYLSAHMPEAVREELLAAGHDPATTVAVAHRVGWPEQELHLSTVRDFPELVRARGLTSQTLFLVLPGHQAGTRSKLYDPAFAHGARPAREDSGRNTPC
ncbi:Cobalt-precorrin-4 C(11)-methyltransferase [Fundidesulfovibrio magnetotacticus]|uniref:Cobalt-precorrin-4 C(11)-methyltransferase n=1 Tax=Fundidesulfovibrio magnetotacticus TaxID=2730080 RepID=A0A6V8LJE8_9BACT|nr:precorrin-4 C(11)-methyltransferase [Fundidesulfovibrio magnetotacticus]GFK92862.1 Cobalt-precorrin-4 C(11)-methyltransferase [Fundidesulfovibrio magnetotacticus]